jgi:hypothetical protein
LAENGQPSAATQLKFKCKCGKLFASITSFDAHEKTLPHRTMFASRDWALDYVAARIRNQEAAEIEPRIDPSDDLSDLDS